MSGGGTGQGALYSPLPQTISDTDSSEEELISVVHHNDSRKFVVSGKESVDKRNGQKMGEYRPLDHDNEQDVAINGFPSRQTTADNVPIIKTEGTVPRHLEPMSPLRKICFVLSIVLCGLTIVIFLWIIPCDWATCPSAPLKTGTKAWEQTLESIELKGRISVVSGVPGRGHNLVFLMREDVTSPLLSQSKGYKDEARSRPPCSRGILSLVGSTGKVAWCKKLRSLPHDIDCSLIDVNGDGVNDCIVVGADKLLMTIDPISGDEIWRLDEHSNAVDIDFPLILPDLDEDGYNELVSACRILSYSGNTSVSSTSDHNNLMLISGKSGTVIGQPLTVNNCSNISNLGLETEYWIITYTCDHMTDKGKVSTIPQMPLQELYTKSTKGSLPSSFTHNQKTYPPLKQHQTLQSTESVDGTWKVHPVRLTINKQCRNYCTIHAKIIDDRSGVPNKVIWNFTADNTHAMIPVPFTLSNKSGGNNPFPSTISGFVLKFWQWNSDQRHMSKDDPSTHHLYRNRLKRRNVNVMDTALHNISRRSVPATTFGSATNISYFHINETIIIVIFNGTKPATFNTSQNSIVQICFHGDQHELSSCQPDISFQEQSMLIADLDQDGSQELISYLTTFNPRYNSWEMQQHVGNGDDHSSPFTITNPLYLQSKVRVIRLETELLKLYESIDDH